MFCGKCGNMIQEGMRFCSKCGKNFELNGDINLRKNEMNLEHTDNYSKDKSGNINSKDLIGIQINSVNNNKNNVGTCILSILFCFFLFIFSISAIFVAVSRSALEEEKIRNLCSEIDITQMNVNYNKKNTGIAEFILEIVSDELINNYNLTESRVNDIINNDIIRNHLENVLVDYIGFIAFGNEPELLNSSDIIEIIKDCSKIIYDETGYIFTENDFLKLENELNNGSMKFLTVNGIKDLVYFDISIISVLLSFPMLIIFISFALLMLILLLLINKWKFKYLCAYVGMTLSIQGSILLLGSLLMFIFNLLSELYLVDILINRVIIYVLLSGLCIFAVGTIMFIIYCKILKK